MSKADQKTIAALGNTFQPTHTRTYQPSQLLTETYQPVGQAQVPTIIPPLVSGVAPAPQPPPVQVPPPAAAAATEG